MMGACGRGCLALSAALAVLSAFLLYSPVPDGFSEPWRLRAEIAPMKIMNLYVTMRSLWYGTGYQAESKNLVQTLIKQMPVPEKPSNLQVSDMVFSDVPVRFYKPETASPNSPAIVFIHGGGWTIGSVDMYDKFCYEMSIQTSFPVLSIEYRLAPEHIFPAAFHDCVNATRYFINKAAEFDVDPTRVVVMGDSAGGNLAAAVSLHLRDINNTPPLKLQVLVYPALQALNLGLPSYTSTPHTFLTGDSMVRYWLLYSTGREAYSDAFLKNSHTTEEPRQEFGHMVDSANLPEGFVPETYNKKAQDGQSDSKIWDELGSIITDPYFSPGLVKNLDNLPHTYIATVANDPLRDEGALYAKRLKTAGIPVTYFHQSSGFHAVLGMDYEESVELKESVFKFVVENA